MNEQYDIRNALETGSKILLYCTLFGLVLILAWFSFFILFGGFVYGIHSKLFSISIDRFYFANYLFMGFAKLIVILLFLIPYISVRLALRKQR